MRSRGLPLNMNGTEGPQAGKIRRFAEKLEERGLTVRFLDERLTTKRVTQTLISADMRRDKRKNVVDMLAAQQILQDFMDAGGWREEPEPADEEYYEGVFHMADNRNFNEEELMGEVTLVDEEGQEVVFEHLLTLEMNGKQYICLAPTESAGDIDEDELVILRIDQDADGNDVYVTIDDDEELDDAFEAYLNIVEADENDD